MAKDAFTFNSYMYRAAVTSFGSWMGALTAAGINPRRMNRHIYPWNQKRIVAAILQLAKKHQLLCYSIVHQHHRSLYEAARTHFGSWRKALITAGINPAFVPKSRQWEKEDVIEAILARAVRNEPLSVTKVTPSSLPHWGIRLFGSWETALESAGLDPKQHIGVRTVSCKHPSATAPSIVKSKRVRRWSCEHIAKALHNRFQAGKLMHISSIRREDRCLYSAIRRYFGSWDQAMLFAGLNPEEYRRPNSSISMPNNDD